MKFSMNMPDDLRVRLRNAAKKKGISTTALILQAIERELMRQIKIRDYMDEHGVPCDR